MLLILKFRSCFLKISQMLSMHMLLLQLSYISLFCFREYSSQKYNYDPEGCPVDWRDLMMVLGGAVMKEEDL